MSLDTIRSLLDAPSAAALVTYRADNSAELRHIVRDDRVVLTVFETVPPFRGVKVSGRVSPDRDPTAVRGARDAIAARYLGVTRGVAFVASRGPGVVIRLPFSAARTWDLEATLPKSEGDETL